MTSDPTTQADEAGPVVADSLSRATQPEPITAYIGEAAGGSRTSPKIHAVAWANRYFALCGVGLRTITATQGRLTHQPNCAACLRALRKGVPHV